MSEEAFNAYLAGFTDGEGYIGSVREGVRITLANCDLAVLTQIRDRLGYGSLKSQQQRSHWTLRWVLDISNYATCLDFIHRVQPYLQIKVDAANKLVAKAQGRTDRRLSLETRNQAIRTAAEAGEMRKQIARRFGISPQLVSRIMLGHTWPSELRQLAKRRHRNALGRFDEPVATAHQSID